MHQHPLPAASALAITSIAPTYSPTSPVPLPFREKL